MQNTDSNYQSLTGEFLLFPHFFNQKQICFSSSSNRIITFVCLEDVY